MINAHRRYSVDDAVALSATAMWLAFVVTPAPAQTWKGVKCTGDSDIPWSEQITGCSNSMKARTDGSRPEGDEPPIASPAPVTLSEGLIGPSVAPL